MKISTTTILILSFFVLFGCQNKKHDVNKHMNQQPFEDLVAEFESPERRKWQKPDSVITFIGAIQGSTVMDLGAGTGYFSFPLVKAGAKVIAADVDKRFLDYIEQRKLKDSIAIDKIETRLVPYDNPKLKNQEVDIVLVVNTYHHIENRSVYFQKVKNGLSKNGKLVIIDFIKEKTEHGPPEEFRMEDSAMIQELVEAGFTKFEIEVNLLPEQHILTAR